MRGRANELQYLVDAIRLATPALSRHRGILAGQLHGRLSAASSGGIRRVLDRASCWTGGVWLRPLAPTLGRPGGPLTLVLAGHSNGIADVRITPDGHYAVSASWDNSLGVWDLKRGIRIHELTAHRSGVHALALTPDGAHAISGGSGMIHILGGNKWVDDFSIVIWEIETGARLHTLAGHKAKITAIAVSEDGDRIVSASADHTLKVWDLRRGLEVRTLAGHASAVTAVLIRSDGHVVSASSDGTIKVWNMGTGNELMTMHGRGGGIEGIALAAGGLVVSRAGPRLDQRRSQNDFNHPLQVWDAHGGVRDLGWRPERVTAMAVTPDGEHLLSSSWNLEPASPDIQNRVLRFWHLRRGEELWSVPAHSNDVNALAISGDGRLAVSGAADSTLKVWDLASGALMRTLSGHSSTVSALALTPGGKYAVSGAGAALYTTDHTLRVWDLEKEDEADLPIKHCDSVNAIAITADGRIVITASSDRTLKVWSAESPGAAQSISGHEGKITGLGFVVTPFYAVSASLDCTVRVWALKTGTELRVMRGTTDGFNRVGINALAVSPDGRHAITSSYNRYHDDSFFEGWDLKTGDKLPRILGKCHTGSVNGIVFYPDGRRFASASSDGTVKVWDLRNKTCSRELPAQPTSILALAVTDNLLVTASALDAREARDAKIRIGADIRIWDLSSGIELYGYSPHSESIRTVAATRDGGMVCSGSDDGTVILWDTIRRLQLAVFQGESGIRSCAFMPDQRTIVVGELSGRVHFLRIEGFVPAGPESQRSDC